MFNSKILQQDLNRVKSLKKEKEKNAKLYNKKVKKIRSLPLSGKALRTARDEVLDIIERQLDIEKELDTVRTHMYYNFTTDITFTPTPTTTKASHRHISSLN